MKKIKFTDVRLVYMCFVLLFMLAREVLPVSVAIDGMVLPLLVFAGGFGIILWDIILNKPWRDIRLVNVIMILFAVSAGISSLVNIRYGFTDNAKAICAMVLEFLIFFRIGANRTKKETGRDLNVMLSLVSIVWTVLVLLSVAMYVFNVEYSFDLGGVAEKSQGFNTEYVRLFGIFQDPNYSGFVSVIAIYSLLYLMQKHKNTVTRVLCVISVLIQISYISLCGSRSAFLMLTAGAVFILVYKSIIPSIRDKSIKNFKISALCVFIIPVLVIGFRYTLPYTKTAILNVTHGEQAVKSVYDKIYTGAGLEIDTVSPAPGQPDENPGVSAVIREDTKKEDTSNGRFTRWRDTVKIFSKTPIVGTSPRNISEFAKDHANGTLMAKFDIAPHNGYLDVLCGGGVVGFVLLAVMLVLMLIPPIKDVFIKEYDSDRAITLLITLILLGSIIFVSDLFYLFTIGATLFYTMSGIAYYQSESNVKTGK